MVDGSHYLFLPLWLLFSLRDMAIGLTHPLTPNFLSFFVSELLQSLDMCENDPVAIARCFVDKVSMAIFLTAISAPQGHKHY